VVVVYAGFMEKLWRPGREIVEVGDHDMRTQIDTDGSILSQLGYVFEGAAGGGRNH
jgi:hypothetical protein